MNKTAAFELGFQHGYGTEKHAFTEGLGRNVVKGLNWASKGSGNQLVQAVGGPAVAAKLSKRLAALQKQKLSKAYDTIGSGALGLGAAGGGAALMDSMDTTQPGRLPNESGAATRRALY